MSDRPKTYKYSEDGVDLEFEYNPHTGLGILRGSPYDWHSYIIIGGAASFDLEREERDWLMESWLDAKKEADQKVLSPEIR